MSQLALLDLPPAPAVEPRQRRDRQPRCPHCRAGYAPPTTTERIAIQRARADRDYTAEWASVVERHPEAVRLVVEAAITEAAGQRPSIDAVWLAIRGRVPRAVSNNNLRSAAARWLMATVPALAGRFRIRGNAGQVER